MESDGLEKEPKNVLNGLCQGIVNMELQGSSCNHKFTEHNVSVHNRDPKSILDQAKKILGKSSYASCLEPFELQSIIARHLNPEVGISENNYRNVASKLGFDTLFIKSLRDVKNPTETLLENCTDIKPVDFAQALYDTKRHDVLSAIVECGKRAGILGQHRYPLPTYGSVEESGDSVSCSMSSFDEDSGISSDPLSASWPVDSRSAGRAQFQEAMRRAPSEQDDAFGSNEDFYSEESNTFWRKIPGNNKQKPWPKFEEALKATCPDEIQKGQVVKLLCHILKITYGDREAGVVKSHLYKMLVACFGPMKAGADGCLQKLYDLIGYSTTKQKGNVKSWFAGHFSFAETENRLSSENPGTFLVRFSESVEGFVLGMQTEKADVKQYHIKVDTETNSLQLGCWTCSTLKELIKKAHDEPVDLDCNEILSVACKDLPINDIFKGYDNPASSNPRGVHLAGASNRGRGRGRGRGKPK